MKKKLSKLVFLLQKWNCKIAFHINHRFYMRMYIPLLKKNGVKINGTPRYIGIHVSFDDFSKIEIGNNTTISDECHLLTHDYSITNAFRATGKILSKDIALVRGIRIGNNVVIGKKSIIMPNCEIGNNCIIGAGAVVRGKIPDGSVVIGNPAQIVGDVFKLAEKWEKLSLDYIRKD